MGLRKEFLWFSILLLVLVLALLRASSVDGSATYRTFKTGSPSEPTGGKPRGRFGADKNEDGGPVFGDEKRKVYTGPNPLHNR